MSSNTNGRPRPVSALSSSTSGPSAIAHGQSRSKNNNGLHPTQSSAASLASPPPTLTSTPSFVRASTVTPTTTKVPTVPASGSSIAPTAPSLQRFKSTVHLPLYRRILFPTDDPVKPVPPLVIAAKKTNANGSGGAGASENSKELELINERLYHLIALALRAYVLSWYSRFTTSRSLPAHINQQIVLPILSPILSDLCTDEGQDRLCAFLLVDLPTILALHIRVYWEARAAGRYLSLNIDEGGSAVGAGKGRLGELFHARLPLLSVTRSCNDPMLNPNTGETFDSSNISGGGGPGSEYTLSPLYLSTLSSSILAHFSIGTNRPDVERLMAREVLSRSVLGSIARRLVEGWFWHMLILKFLGEPGGYVYSEDEENEATEESDNARAKAKAEGGSWPKQDGSHEKETAEAGRAPDVQAERAGHDKLNDSGTGSRGGATIDQLILYYILKIWSTIALIYSALINLVTLYSESPARSDTMTKPDVDPLTRCWEPSLLLLRELLGIDGRSGLGHKSWLARMSWAGVEMLVGLFGQILDSLLPHLIRTYLLTPQLALKSIDTIERLLFPLEGGWPGPSPVDPTPEEAVDLRRRAERRLQEIVPCKW
ncbi:hypothetical protein I316_03838 [Kwoniella heveanensis BCC8398]|uniref:PXA domain-containing protein n=1 Tax=Kwoniella heveanensis BCC8398 TaxID=1296120 RepID=A0A1B9GTD2_9TREE|nr:hypothetical protein I316_03838 [Kwoniella heveanensis BCC8398]